MRRALLTSILLLAEITAESAVAQYVGYRPADFWGGYSEKEIEPRVWRVSVRLNALSGGGPVARAMANYRAAELMKQQGFSHMRVMRQSGFALGLTVGTSQAISGGPGYARIVIRGATDSSDVSGCRMRSADACVTVSVDEMMASWRPYLDFRR